MDLIDGIVHPPKLRVLFRQTQLAHPVLSLMVRKIAAVGIVGALEHRFGGESLVPGAVFGQRFPARIDTTVVGSGWR